MLQHADSFISVVFLIIISCALKNEKEGNWNKTRTYTEYKHLAFVTVPMIFNVFFNALL